MWDIIIPIATFLIGIILGAVVAGYYLKNQFTKMQTDPKQIQALAKSMGMNLSQKQLNTMTRQMSKTKTVKKNKKPSK